MSDNNKNPKLPPWVMQLLIDCFLLLVAVGFWHLGEWAKNKDELFISVIIKTSSISLMAMIAWPVLNWVAKKTNSTKLVGLAKYLAILGKYSFYTVGAVIDIGKLFTIGIFSILVVYAIFSLPFVAVSKYVFSMEHQVIVYFSISLVAIVFLEFGRRIFNILEKIMKPLIEHKPSRASFIEVYRLLFSGMIFRILVYFLFFLYLIFYAFIDLSNITDISIDWIAWLYDIKESVLHAFYTVLAYDAFRINLVNYEPKKY